MDHDPCSSPAPSRLLRQCLASNCSRAGWECLLSTARQVAQLIYPDHCPGCSSRGTEDGRLCTSCQRDVWVEPLCGRCARPLPEGLAESDDCPHCRRKRLPFDHAVAVGVYQGPLRELVIRMKRRSETPLTASMGRMLADRVQARLATRPDVLAPVPIHWLRRMLRGVHGPAILAEQVAAQLACPMRERLLVCRRKTSKQGTLLPTERIQNVRHAFALSRGYDLGGKHVLLVDDVMTTGATLIELTRLLRRAGAALVSVAVVARGIGYA